MGNKSGLLVPIDPSWCIFLGPTNFELRITIYWIGLEIIVNSIKILFDTSLPRVVGHEMLFLCLSFAVPSTTRWESIQSSLVKMLAGFAFNRRDVHKCNRQFHDSNEEGIQSIALWELFRITRIVLHCPFHECRFRIVTKWVADVILLQFGLKCFSMRMTLDFLHEFAITEVISLSHNCMWQSRHSEVNVYFLSLCEQIDGLSTSNKSLLSYMMCVYVFVCVIVLI